MNKRAEVEQVVLHVEVKKLMHFILHLLQLSKSINMSTAKRSLLKNQLLHVLMEFCCSFFVVKILDPSACQFEITSLDWAPSVWQVPCLLNWAKMKMMRMFKMQAKLLCLSLAETPKWKRLTHVFAMCVTNHHQRTTTLKWTQRQNQQNLACNLFCCSLWWSLLCGAFWFVALQHARSYLIKVTHRVEVFVCST